MRLVGFWDSELHQPADMVAVCTKEDTVALLNSGNGRLTQEWTCEGLYQG